MRLWGVYDIGGSPDTVLNCNPIHSEIRINRRVAIFRETRNGSIRFRERKIGDVYCLRRPAFVLRQPGYASARRTLASTMTLRRFGCLMFCLRPCYRTDSDKTSGPPATRGSSHTTRPLALPRFLCSFTVCLTSPPRRSGARACASRPPPPPLAPARSFSSLPRIPARSGYGAALPALACTRLSATPHGRLEKSSYAPDRTA
jgi:hypothetical protein